MTTTRSNCLFILSAAIEGVSAQSFSQAYTLAQTPFNVQLASPGGKAIEYVQQDDSSRRWLIDFQSKAIASPLSLETIEPSRYAALLLPHCPGAVNDLANNEQLSSILHHFITEKKPICAIGMGVAGLCCARQRGSWSLAKYCMTSTSVSELAKTSSFGSLPLIPEDFIKDHGASYTSSEPDAIHVVIDRHLITAQNEQSTLTAVQNLILLCDQRKKK